VNLELSFPIYASLDEIPVLRGVEAILHGRTHSALQPSLIAHWAVSRDQTVLETSEVKVPKPQQCGGINAFSLTTRLDPIQFGMRDSVSFQLYHRKLGRLGGSCQP
jgi:hypothetical protein